MRFSEDDLKEALRRKDPGPSFAQRVMARIGQVQESEAVRMKAKKGPLWLRWVIAQHPALASALAALVLAIGGGLGYEQHQRAQEQKRVESQRAELAKEQVVQALKITNAKLNHVFRRVSEPSAGEPKIRRETL